jgi:transposase
MRVLSEARSCAASRHRDKPSHRGVTDYRHAVIWRKLSFGTQSPGGSRFVETMLTVIETCRQQSRNVFEYVTEAVHAHYAQQSTPSLLSRV